MSFKPHYAAALATQNGPVVRDKFFPRASDLVEFLAKPPSGFFAKDAPYSFDNRRNNVREVWKAPPADAGADEKKKKPSKAK